MLETEQIIGMGRTYYEDPTFGVHTDSCDVEVTAAGKTRTIQTIDDPVDPDGTTVGYYTYIAVDASNHVQISYYDYCDLNLKYATNRMGSWVGEVLDEEGSVGRHTSPAVGLDGYSIHISYHYQAGEEEAGLKYAHRMPLGHAQLASGSGIRS